MCLFDSFSKAFASPAYIRKVCVRLHSENSEPTSFSQMTPDEHPPTPPPCRWPTLITTHPHQISARWALPVMLCCSAPSASSSAPLRPSVRYPSFGLIVNITCMRTFCDHINVSYFRFRPELYRFAVRLELYDGANARQIVSPSLSPSHAPTPPPNLWPALITCLLYTSPSPRDKRQSRMPSSA